VKMNDSDQVPLVSLQVCYIFICGTFFLTKGKLGLLQFVPCIGKYIHFHHLAFKFPLYPAVL
jgi:hypothetical protein